MYNGAHLSDIRFWLIFEAIGIIADIILVGCF